MRQLISRAKGLVESRWILLAAALLVIGCGCGLAIWLQPQPHSDWGYYWMAAGSPASYERGGIGLWLLAAPKALGLSPVASALYLNAASVAAVTFVLWKLDRTPWRLPTWLTIGYLLLVAPYLGVVQLDVLAAALLALGIWCIASHGASTTGRIVMGALLVAGGVSTKPQYALVLWAMTGLAVPFLPGIRTDKVMGTLFGILLAGSITGFALDNALRSASGRSEAIRTNSAVTLYGGLLVSGTGPGCGYWSPEAAEAAKADLGEPLHTAVMRRLSEQPAAHWAEVLECKLPEIVRPPPFALYWLVESPSVRQWLNAHPDRHRLERTYQTAMRMERFAYSALTLALMVLSALTVVLKHRHKATLSQWLPVLWVLSFWLVHAVFEIQGRYFLGMYLLLPVFVLLGMSPRPTALAAATKSPLHFPTSDGDELDA